MGKHRLTELLSRGGDATGGDTGAGEFDQVPDTDLMSADGEVDTTICVLLRRLR